MTLVAGAIRRHGRATAALAVALVLGTVYTLTLLPGVGHSGDTAKFQFIGRVLGTPHSTGYPTYLLLNHVFTSLFPWGTLAWKANLLSALFAVLACLALLRVLAELAVRPTLAAVTALIFGLTRTFWSQAVIAEVYTLNALFVALVVLFLVRWTSRPEDRRAFRLAALMYALSFGNHLTVLTLLPAVLVFVFAVDRRVYINLRLVAYVLFCVALGAAQYLYFFWRQNAMPPAPMEMIAPDFSTFWSYATGTQFRERMFSQPLAQVITVQVPAIAGHIWRELGPLLLLVPVGAAAVRNRRVLLLLGLGLAGLLVFVVNYLIPDIVTYLLPATLFLCITIGVGLEGVTRWLERWAPRLPVALFTAVPVALLVLNLPHANQRHNVADARTTEEVLARIGQHAVILTPDYHQAYYYRYYLLGERRQQRDDVYLVYRVEPAAVADYVLRGGDVSIPFQRLTIPPGLTVHDLDATQVGQLREHGLCAREVAPGLFKVSACDSLVPSDAAVLRPVSDGTVAFQSGWGPVEPWGRWALAAEAELALRAAPGARRLVIAAATWPGLPGAQQCRVLVDGSEIGRFTVAGPPWTWQEYEVAIPDWPRAGERQLVLRFAGRWRGGEQDTVMRALPVRCIESRQAPGP